jgi:flagellar hook-basal body complex protein FliE
MGNTISGLPHINWDQVRIERHQPAEQRVEFLDTLKRTLNQAAQLQSDAEQQVAQVLAGNGEDVHAALIAVEKADLSFQLMMQVRNKIIQAYQDIARMPF